jgi:hypothetical protein
VKVATIPGTGYDVAGLQPGSTYGFKVEAEDANGHESGDGPAIMLTVSASGSSGDYFETFDAWADGTPASGNGWTFQTTTDTGIEVVALPSGGKALQARDGNYDQANEYLESPLIRRVTSPISGKVVAETKFMFKQINHPNGSFYFSFFGNGTEVARFLRFSDGGFGYTNSDGSYSKIPSSSGISLPIDQWITLRVDLDTEAKTYSLTLQSDAFKGFSGTVTAPVVADPAAGTFRVSGLPFLNSSTNVSSINEITLRNSRYTGILLYDYLTMYEDTN